MIRPTFYLALAALALALTGCGGSTSGGGGGGGGGGAAATGFIAYTLGPDPANQRVFVQNAVTGTFQSQSPTVPGVQPAMSPDGTKVAWSSPSGPNIGINIQTVNQDATRLRIASGGTGAEEPRFSPTTGFIFYVNRVSPTRTDIWQVNQSGTINLRVTDRNSLKGSPAVSPNGLQLAFFELIGGSYRMIRRDIATGVESTVVSGYPVSTPAPQVSWYDNTRLLFSAVVGGVQRVMVVDQDGTDLTTVTDGFRPRRSNGGERILFGRQIGGGIQAFTCTLSGSNVSQYTVAAGQVSDSWDWSRPASAP
jgi:Tol biopolymer transport system component